jgi:hypothetical protein
MVLTFFPSTNVSAQVQDTTPPMLLDFSISPVLFDTSTQDATVSFCVAAADNLAGVGNVCVRADSPSSTPISGFFGISLNFQGANNATVCGSAVIPVGSPFEVEPLLITLTDRVGNTRLVGNPSNPICALDLYGQCEHLCDLGLPCVVENRSSLTVIIDIKPGDGPNSINPGSKEKIPVAILTSDTFDATTVDPTTIRFGETGTEGAPIRSGLEDVDGDGDADMILHFNTQTTGIHCGDTSASLTGETFSGQMIEGADSIRTVGCR